MILLKINCSRIPKERLFKGKNGLYADMVLFENRDGPDRFGNDGFVAMSQTKEERERKEKSVIIGNWKTVGKSSTGQNKPDKDVSVDNSDDVPF